MRIHEQSHFPFFLPYPSSSSSSSSSSFILFAADDDDNDDDELLCFVICLTLRYIVSAESLLGGKKRQGRRNRGNGRWVGELKLYKNEK